MSHKNVDSLLKAIETHVRRMCDPNHPVYRVVIERDGYGLDQAGQPEVVAFHLKVEHLAGVVHLPVAGHTGLVMPTGEALRASVPPQPVVEQPQVVSDLERVSAPSTDAQGPA